MQAVDTSLQIYDISIDKVNKPFLPVASGEMSVQFAWVAVRLAAPKVRVWCLTWINIAGARARCRRSVHRDL